MNRTLALGILSIGLLGCAATPPALEQQTTYQVEWLGKRPLIDRSHLTLTLDKDGRAYGNAGCNHWFATYHLDGDRLSFDQAGSTRKMCAPALMEQEQRFLEMLATIQRWDYSESQGLRLWPAQGDAMRLWPGQD
ncbi:META domain-containing protein [Pseudomonas sp. LS44]|uniref:META domain-containing protein n=1 Tax=Pseudomonas sp. LS44 TaxID=1357074 RepID=UPI00215B6652|nr:META domain-containing protein [Pseudomonas sp. LS44]UVE16627.1 META domain-containing protein [Pseudomonas sp. LS44]